MHSVDKPKTAFSTFQDQVSYRAQPQMDLHDYRLPFYFVRAFFSLAGKS